MNDLLAQLDPRQFWADLTNPVLVFLPKALLVCVLASVVCGLVGCHVVLRGMAFIGDAVAHAVFPGVAVAFVLQGSMLVGGLAAGIATAVLVALFSQNGRVREDSVIGIFFAAAFALGILVMSRAPGYGGSLTQFLVGSITGVPDREVVVVGLVSALVVAVLTGLHKELVAVSLDRELARAARLPVTLLDLLLYVLVSVCVVVSVQTVGTILVIALLVTPAATARLLTDRLTTMMALAAAIGAGSSLLGLYLSWCLDLPTGATIVIVATAVFVTAWALAPRHGLLRRRPARRRRSCRAGLPHPAPTGVRRSSGSGRARRRCARPSPRPAS